MPSHPHPSNLAAIGILAVLLAEGPVRGQDPPYAVLMPAELERMTGAPSPGCAVGAERDGQVLYVKGAGLANLDHAVPISPDTVFHAGSIAKQFTAYATLLLAARGKLQLEDPITKYVSGFPGYANAITIRHLLQHTSGLRDQWDLRAFAGHRPDQPADNGEMMDLLRAQGALNFEPGTQHVYNNSGYTVLAAIVEKAAGVSLADFAKREIFGPLGMSHTQFIDDRFLIIPTRATGYLPREEGGWGAVPASLETPGPTNLVTTVRDMLKWTHVIYSPSSEARSLVEQMRTQVQLPSKNNVQYGMGLYVAENRGRPVILHGGAERGFISEMFVLPESRFGAIALCNRWNVNAAGLVRSLADQIAPAPTPVASAAPAPGASAAPAPSQEGAPLVAPDPAIAALYRAEGSGRLRRMLIRERRIGWEGTDGNMVARGSRIFSNGDQTLTFTPARGRSPARLQIARSGQSTIVYVQLKPFAPGQTPISSFAGRYRSDELSAEYTLSVESGKLVIRGPGGIRAVGAPIFHDGFQLDFMEAVIEFERDARGQIAGFKLSTGRSRNISFARVI